MRILGVENFGRVGQVNAPWEGWGRQGLAGSLAYLPQAHPSNPRNYLRELSTGPANPSPLHHALAAWSTGVGWGGVEWGGMWWSRTGRGVKAAPKFVDTISSKTEGNFPVHRATTPKGSGIVIVQSLLIYCKTFYQQKVRQST